MFYSFSYLDSVFNIFLFGNNQKEALIGYANWPEVIAFGFFRGCEVSWYNMEHGSVCVS